MQDTKAKILLNERYRQNYFMMRLEAGWEDFVPGQFVMVAVPGGKSFLRRPFGIARLTGEGILEICYKVVGKGTLDLSSVPVGTNLQVLGPIGKGFDISKGTGNISILVAGGYGIAPLLGLAEALVQEEDRSNIHLFYGAQNEEHLLYLDEFKEMGIGLHVATQDGSLGAKGLVTDELKKFLLSTINHQPSTIFACGPHGMLGAIKMIAAKNRNISSCQLSMESYMACGLGVCAGCVVKDSLGNFVRVCKEGPVFEARELSDI